jgi:hypothetical protein
MSTEPTQPARAELLPIELLASPFVRFAKLEAAGGILLLVSTINGAVYCDTRLW